MRANICKIWNGHIIYQWAWVMWPQLDVGKLLVGLWNATETLSLIFVECNRDAVSNERGVHKVKFWQIFCCCRLRKYAAPKVHWFAKLLVLAGWLTSISIVALVPIDVWATLAHKQSRSIFLMWSISYWYPPISSWPFTICSISDPFKVSHDAYPSLLMIISVADLQLHETTSTLHA